MPTGRATFKTRAGGKSASFAESASALLAPPVETSPPHRHFSPLLRAEGRAAAMRKRRFAQVSTSDEDEDEEETEAGRGDKEGKGPRKPRGGGEESRRGAAGKGKVEDGGDGEGDGGQEDAKPVGDVVKVSGKGRKKKKHYAAFEYDGLQFELEDPVLVSPEVKNQKPYVAIIKDITQDSTGSVMVVGQWFYRPEEAEKKGGGTWQACDTRELFYSFHIDEVPAESVMHKCVVHFVPPNKQLPVRSQHPGFIVRKVYDAVERKLWKLTDKDYEDTKQQEINLLVEKTRQCLGELPEIETEETCVDQDDLSKGKRLLRKKSMLSVDVSRDDNAISRSDLNAKAETPGSCTSEASEFFVHLKNFKALTRDAIRDKWLEKLLQGIQFVCVQKENGSTEVKGNGADSTSNATNGAETADVPQAKNPNIGESLLWPDVAVPALTALEKAAYETLGSDFQKYNQKMRQLDFNLKNNALLARRLLKKELEATVVLNMTPKELKDGWTADEKTSKEPEQSQYIQMTDARCSRCKEKKVGLADIIHAGGGTDRYQLECISCGYHWYASRDAISSLTIDAPTVVGNVGTAPWATAKFEDVEKSLLSPRESEKPVTDLLRKTTAPYMPVLETQRPFNRSRSEDPSVSAPSKD